MLSLSARRAWIEIITRFKRERKGMVALRKESVDRNNFVRHSCNCISIVALRKESVDRNLCGGMTASSATGRSPQGERG